MKKSAVAMLVGAFILASTVSSMAIGITVDSKKITTDVEPYITNGRTMVPVSTIGRALGAKVEWDAVRKDITINLENKEIIMNLQNSYMTIDKDIVNLDSKPVIKDGRTMVPLSAIAKAFGREVSWEPDTKTVVITSPKQQPSQPVTTPSVFNITR